MKELTLTTKRLRLRRIGTADLEAVYAIFSDARVMRYWSSPAQSSIEQARVLIDTIVDGYKGEHLLQLGIERLDTAQLIGTCTLHDRSLINRRAELGYALGADHWGHGLMHEALQRFLQYIFDDLDLNRLEADIDPRNQSSARTLERLGFTREGYARERWIVNGEVSDTAWYGLLARDWREPNTTLKDTP